MDRRYCDAVKNINKILEIIDMIGEEQFRECMKSYISSGKSAALPDTQITTPYVRHVVPNSSNSAIRSYQKSLSLKREK